MPNSESSIKPFDFSTFDREVVVGRVLPHFSTNPERVIQRDLMCWGRLSIF